MHGWQIIEEDSYRISATSCGTPQQIDEALASITYALHRNPTGFSKIPGHRSLYIAKTKLRLTLSEIIPSYRRWFAADEASRTVRKLWIEMTPPEDMAFDDNGLC